MKWLKVQILLFVVKNTFGLYDRKYLTLLSEHGTMIKQSEKRG